MIYKVNFKVKKILNKKNKNIDCFFFFLNYCLFNQYVYFILN